MRRAELSQHNHISGKYLISYAREMAWKEDHRRVDNGAQPTAVTCAALAHPVSYGDGAGIGSGGEKRHETSHLARADLRLALSDTQTTQNAAVEMTNIATDACRHPQPGGSHISVVRGRSHARQLNKEKSDSNASDA